MILFFGDTHGKFNHLIQTVIAHQPAAIIIVGDIQADKPLHEALESILDKTDIWWIPGDHDSDNQKYYDNVFGSELADKNLHGRIVSIDGQMIAGLGGIFRESIWHPGHTNKPPVIDSYEELENRLAGDLLYNKISQEKLDGQLLTHRASVFFSDWYSLYGRSADVLVTHEAPSCHPHGFAVIDELAQSLGVKNAFHGHHHDKLDYSQTSISLGFKANGIGLRGACDVEGNPILQGDLDQKRQRKLSL